MNVFMIVSLKSLLAKFNMLALRGDFTGFCCPLCMSHFPVSFLPSYTFAMVVGGENRTF